MCVDLIAVAEPVAVSVRDHGVGPVGRELRIVVEPIAVGVGQRGVGFVLHDLVEVAYAIAIGVGERWIGAVDRDLIAVIKPVIVGVGVERVSTRGDLVAIQHPVAIAVGVERVEAHGNLFTVIESVLVAVRLRGIGSGGVHLVKVAESVLVGVLRGGIGAEDVLLRVGDEVAVGVELRADRPALRRHQAEPCIGLGVGVEAECSCGEHARLVKLQLVVDPHLNACGRVVHTDPVGREVGPPGEASCEASSDDGHPAGMIPEVRLFGDAIDIDPTHDGASGGGPLVGLLPVEEDELLGVVGVRPDEPPDKVIVGGGVHTHVELHLDACGWKRRDVGRRS